MSLNNVTLIGRLVANVELRTTASGKNVASFTIAVDRSFTKTGEEKQTDFINIVAWNQTADFICRYFKKGSMIALVGSLQTRSYEDKNGNKRKAFEVVAREVSFCGGKNETNQVPTTMSAPADISDFEEIPDDDDLPF